MTSAVVHRCTNTRLLLQLLLPGHNPQTLFPQVLAFLFSVYMFCYRIVIAVACFAHLYGDLFDAQYTSISLATISDITIKMADKSLTGRAAF